jgi:hypothetical protein
VTRLQLVGALLAPQILQQAVKPWPVKRNYWMVMAQRMRIEARIRMIVRRFSHRLVAAG